MKVEAPLLEKGDGEETLAATVDGRRLWFRAPSGMLGSSRVEPFVVAALPAAMASGEPLEVDPRSEMSPRLLGSLATIQDMLHSWNPRLAKVEIRARAGAPPPSRSGVGLLFSGGVDATYTLFRHEEEITHLIFIHGLEIGIANETLFAQALARNQESARRYQKVLVPVKTNLRDLALAHNISNYLYQGPLLAAVVLALGLPRTYLAASLTYGELYPWGTHPMLDPLWSTEGSEIVHDGAGASRASKIAAIGARPGALESLRVCLANRPQYNCGTCEKCLRTMIALRLLGLESPAFPPLDSVRAVRRLRVANEEELLLFLENHALAVAKGDHAAARALGSCIRRYRLRQILKLCDLVVTDGRLLKRWRHWRYPNARKDPILPGSPRD